MLESASAIVSYGRADSVCDLFHVQVTAVAGERVHVGARAVSWHMARQLCRSLLVDVAIEVSDG